MILFYAWTDTQIINAINVKGNIYPNEKAELLVYKLDRVSNELLENVSKKNYFENIYRLEKPPYYLERRRAGLREKVAGLFLGKVLWKYFETKLNVFLGEKKYSLFLTGAFWSETLLVIRYLKKTNLKIKIAFYEEGLAAYNGADNWLFQAVPAKGIKAWIRTFLYYGLSSHIYRKNVKEIYLYNPQLSNITYLEKKFIDLKRMCTDISELVESKEEDAYYQTSDIIFLTEAPDFTKVDCLESIYKVLDEIYFLPQNIKVVIKLHPLVNLSNIIFDEEKYPNVMLDNRAIQIESILKPLDLENKVIITGNSTCALYIKWLYGKTPYMVLMNMRKDVLISEYFTRYVENYDKGKAYIVESYDELRTVINLLFS